MGKDVLKDCDLPEIYRDCFKDHKVFIKDLDCIKIIEFQKPGTSNYYIKYIIDRNSGNLIVTGDLDDAIYSWYGNIFLDFLAGLNIGYFNSKCTANEGGNYEWDREEADRNIDQHWKDYYEEEYNDCHISCREELDKIKIALENLQNYTDDEMAYENEASNYDAEDDAWEWIYDVGKVIPLRHRLHLYGLKIIKKKIGG